jgi:PBP1b-binding outer membrane lipoprotein LpoB
MNKTKKIALLVALPAFALVLSGCGKQTAPASQSPAKTQQESAKPQQPTPPVTFQQQQDPVASPSQPLPPLPTDNKKAIDTELSNIDKELQTTDNTINSNDLSNANLGL